MSLVPLGTVAGVPELLIRPVDPHDDADMDAFQEVYAAAELAEDPDAALYSRADGVALLLSSGRGGELWEGYGAFTGDGMVGELIVTGNVHDNLQVARVFIWTHPSHQRHGIGTALSSYADERVRELGRSICHAQARIGVDRANGNRAFAERMGYVLANTEIERKLPLPPDLDLLDRLAAEAAPHHQEYEIRTVVGPVPDGLAASYVALRNMMNVEMPSGDLEVEAGEMDTAELAVQDRYLVDAGRTRVASYALDSSGTVVAYSVAAVSNEHHDHVDQWGTLVHPAHRGHRLGMAVKCDGLRALAEHFPEKRFIETTNAETNAHMVEINEALGFEVAEVYGDFQKRLP
ncbi:MAG: GNAT family N-acetyltransferase [Nocardioides sp.]|nr:GNAT family N-acetyltransferase [Nocardioides sp.]